MNLTDCAQKPNAEPTQSQRRSNGNLTDIQREYWVSANRTNKTRFLNNKMSL